MRRFICLNCKKEFFSEKFDKNRIPKYCCMPCFQNRIKKPETIEKMAIAKRGRTAWNKGIEMWKIKPHPKGTLGKRGLRTKERCHFWKGGVTSENMKIRKSSDYIHWRKKVFERDNFTCVLCSKIGGKLNADHIFPFSTHPELRMEISNGRTLCISCHLKTDTFGAKMNKKIKCAHAF